MDLSTGEAHPASWVAGASSFPARSFHQHREDQQKEDTRINLEKALQYLEQSSEDEEEDGSMPHGQGEHMRGAHAMHAAAHMARSKRAHSPSSSSGSSGSSSDVQGHRHRRGKDKRSSSGRRHERSSKQKKAKKRKHTSERDKILRAEQKALASGINLPERRGGVVWAGDNNTLGYAGANALDREFMCRDTTGDILNLSYHCLHKNDMPLFKRRDPLGLAKGLPSSGFAHSDEHTKGPASRGVPRYFHARYQLLERSRNLRRITVRNSTKRPLLASLLSAPAAAAAAAEDAAAAYPGAGCWGKPVLQQQAAAARGGLSLPLPAVLSLSGDNARAAGDAFVGGHAAAATSAAEYLRMGQQQQQQQQEPEGETIEEYVLRRTKEHNIATRERPWDLHLWLDFARFQVEAAQLMGRRGADAATHEKQVAVLERALEHHPGNEELLLALLEASTPLLDPEQLCSRWQQVLKRHKGSAALWCQYLRVRKGMFSLFKVPRLQVVYADALHELALECAHQRSAESWEKVVHLEEALVRINLDLIHFELQAGHTERAVARIQAVLEFHCFNPNQEQDSGSTSAPVKRKPGYYGAQLTQFENFWEAGVPRIGEEGAQGWSAWFKHENRCGAAGAGDSEDEAEQQDRGGWGGWEVLTKASAGATEAAGTSGGQQDSAQEPEAKQQQGTAAEKTDNEEGENSQEEEEEGEVEEGSTEEEEEEEEEEVSEAELLARLGVKLEQDLEAMQRRGVEPPVLSRWLEEEQKRDGSHWRPLLARKEDTPGQAGSAAGGDALSIIHYEDIQESLFPLENGAAREHMLLGCLALLGAPLLGLHSALAGPCMPPPTGPWACTNTQQLLDDRQTFFACAAAAPAVSPATTAATAADAAGASGLPELGGALPWFCGSEERRAMLSRVMQMLLDVGSAFEGHPHLTTAYLAVEAADVASLQQEQQQQQQQGRGRWEQQLLLWRRCQLGQAARAREAAGKLLDKQRDNRVLAACLGALQAELGKTAVARRIFDSALAGSSGRQTQQLPGSLLLPVLVLQYADAELAMAAAGNTSPAVAQARALHVLQWFLENGCGGTGSSSSGDVRPFQPYSVSKAPAAAEGSAAGPPSAEAVKAARTGFGTAVGSWLGDAIQAVLGTGAASAAFLAAAAAAAVAASMLYEVLVARQAGHDIQLSAGPEAAIAAFKNILGGLPARQRASSALHEWLHVRLCRLLVQEQQTRRQSGMRPGAVREQILHGLRLYPQNPELLSALEVSERAGHANVRLRLALQQALEAGPSPQLLEAALRAEAGRVSALSSSSSSSGHGPGAALAVAAMERVLEKGVAAPKLAASAQAWHLYLRLEVSMGKLDAARRVLLRAVRECPGCKPLWLEGLAELNGVIPPREVGDLLEVAADKGLRLRTDVMEAMLEELAQQQ